MPDWNKQVRRRIAALKLPATVKDEITAELAAHMEEIYEEACRRGLSNKAAIRIALQEVGNWSDLSRKVGATRSTEDAMTHRTKTLWLPAIGFLFATGLVLVLIDRAPALQQVIWIASFAVLFGAIASEANTLNHRTKQFWLPGFVSMTAASLFLFAANVVSDPSRFFTDLGLHPQGLFRVASGPSRTFYICWITAHVGFGALGAFISRRAGGTRTARILASMFPALTMFFLCGIVIPVSAFAEHNIFVQQHPMTLLFGTLIWAVIPGIALLAGAAPFLKESTGAVLAG